MTTETIANECEALIVSAPGKVILFGEHAVVYGKTAIAASLGIHTHALLLPTISATQTVRLILTDLEFESEWTLASLLHIQSLLPSTETITPYSEWSNEAREATQALINVQDGPVSVSVLAFLYLFVSICSRDFTKSLTITIKSALPVGSGLGSSASYNVCLSAGLLELFNKNQPTKESINTHAFEAEKIMHGNPSGIDNSICTFGGTQSYTKASSLRPITSSSQQQYRFLLINTQIPKTTKTQVEKVRTLHTQYPEITSQIISSIDAISKSYESSPPSPESLAKLMEINQALLMALGVSHPVIDRIVSFTREKGFVTKLTGAGGGGCLITLLGNETDSAKITDMVKTLETEFGCECFVATIGGEGVHISSVKVCNNRGLEAFRGMDARMGIKDIIHLIQQS